MSAAVPSASALLLRAPMRSSSAAATARAAILSASVPSSSSPAPSPAAAGASRIVTRGAHDLVIKRKTGKPIIKSGPYGGGRSSASGHVATVFGCTGFLGRYLVNRLAQRGTQVIVPYRDEEEKRHLKVLGDLGQVVPMEWDLRDDQQTEECLRHSDIVYNLVGRNYETKNFKFADVHVHGAERIAQIAEAAGVSRFVHVSHLNADLESPSAFYRTKAEGEIVVKRAFEGATIVRPGPIFGHEDRLLNQMASWPITWHVNYGKTTLRPVHSLDVALALDTLMDAEETSIGQTFSLAGPKRHTSAELLNLVESLTLNKIVRLGLNVPKVALMTAARVGDLAWWPMLSPDEVERRYIDDKEDEPGTKSWADLGITPDAVEEVAISYLRRYRGHLTFELPVERKTKLGKKQVYRTVQ
ncbi:Protein-lysine N-methyltransferase efm5 [Tilletia horrida]|uniref:Protein-lysine N-methyltransferase efm5 n=1 Tax=Tilletia horrida TaxID=155126 RepID=A0AAN6JUB4_9BASI|nr:Protein-lysine N-methyltransferase efm5 [Tilletia horrida]KAK0556845.1 Protein-lysine N-methyltransferase efm5 [Tilletia horrida]KAK0569219.1 Protein-lysine N-methyltransferase efm5 [Tilletia horrida]